MGNGPIITDISVLGLQEAKHICYHNKTIMYSYIYKTLPFHFAQFVSDNP